MGKTGLLGKGLLEDEARTALGAAWSYFSRAYQFSNEAGRILFGSLWLKALEEGLRTRYYEIREARKKIETFLEYIAPLGRPSIPYKFGEYGLYYKLVNAVPYGFGQVPMILVSGGKLVAELGKDTSHVPVYDQEVYNYILAELEKLQKETSSSKKKKP